MHSKDTEERSDWKRTDYLEHSRYTEVRSEHSRDLLGTDRILFRRFWWYRRRIWAHRRQLRSVRIPQKNNAQQKTDRHRYCCCCCGNCSYFPATSSQNQHSPGSHYQVSTSHVENLKIEKTDWSWLCFHDLFGNEDIYEKNVNVLINFVNRSHIKIHLYDTRLHTSSTFRFNCSLPKISWITEQADNDDDKTTTYRYTIPKQELSGPTYPCPPKRPTSRAQDILCKVCVYIMYISIWFIVIVFAETLYVLLCFFWVFFAYRYYFLSMFYPIYLWTEASQFPPPV